MVWVWAGVLMVVPVEQRSEVRKSWWARFASGSHDSVVLDFPILRGPLRHQGRRATVSHLRAMPGLGGRIGAVAGVGTVCAAPGSTGDRRPRFAVNVGVEVWVVSLVLWWWRGRCFPRAPLTLGVLLVSRGGHQVLLTSGWTDARSAVSRGVTQNFTNTVTWQSLLLW